MATSTRRVYWDACAWIALIQREKVEVQPGAVEDREALCKQVIAQAEKGKIEIATSALSYAEVCKNPQARKQQEDKIAEYFEHEYILTIPVDRGIGEEARKLMMSGVSGLKPPDAIHVASAAFSNSEEMHTFDKKLLVLSGKVLRSDGKPLVITRPSIPMPPAPLLEELNNGQENE